MGQNRNMFKKYFGSNVKKGLLGSVAGVVAVVTVCSLMLPATALSEACDLQEHQHGPECYVQVSAPQSSPSETTADAAQPLQAGTGAEETGQWQLICELPEHIHTDECNAVPQGTAEPSEQTEPQGTAAPSEQTEPQGTAAPSEQTEPQGTIAPSEQTEPQGTTAPSEQTPKEETDEVPAVPVQADESAVQPPIQVEPFIQEAKLRYKTKDPNSVWTDIQDGVSVPGDAKLRLSVKFENVPIRKLLASDGKMTFEVPALMRNPEAQGEIKSGDRTVGTIASSGNDLTLTFDRKWLEELQQSNENNIFGEFFVLSDINLSVIPENGGSVDIVLGSVELKPNFDADMTARHGVLTVEKSITNHMVGEGNVHQLEYTLTVRTGEDGIPDVKVVDHFTRNGQFVKYDNITAQPKTLTSTGSPRETIMEGKQHGKVYKGAEPTPETPIPPADGQQITEPGSLVWEIGTMGANEVRTLVYTISLHEHQHRAAGEPLRNEAKAFSKQYKRDDAVADFTAKAELDIRKSHTQPQRNEDGSYTISYTVVLTAPKSNNHLMENVVVTDSLDHQAHMTDPKALPYITYDKQSFRLFRSANAEGQDIPVNGVDGSLPKLVYGEDGKRFTLSLGDMHPGESYSFRYSIRVGVEAFAAGHLELLKVKNRAAVESDFSAAPNQKYQKKFDDTCDIGYKNWIRKSVSDPLGEDLTVAMKDHIYDGTQKPIVPDAAKPSEFTVPAGSYRYRVEVNHLGDFDVTQADIQDELKSPYMRYTGYLQIDAFDTKQKTKDPLGTLVQTRWLKIDELRSFRLQLKDVQFQPNQYAYRLTYYTKLVDVGEIIEESVRNIASIQGQVSTKDHTIHIDEFQSATDVVIHGGHRFETSKEPWYYERPTKASGTWSKGAIYWGIKIDGTSLHAGKYIKDHVKKEDAFHDRGEMYFHNDSFVGMYKGTLPEGMRFNDYSDLNALLAQGKLTQIPESAYEITYKNVINLPGENMYSDIIVKMLQTVDMAPGESIFLFIKGEPNRLPTDYRSRFVFTNYVATSSDGSQYIQVDKADKYLYGGQNILKEFGSYFSFDGKNFTTINQGKHGHIPYGLLTEPGHYISWAAKLNYGGDLAGRYRVVDELPEGLDLAFVRLKWRGSALTQGNILMEKIEGLGDEWQEHQITAGMDANQGQVTSYYYTNGRKILWEVDNLIAGHNVDSNAIDFQIVARVTDPDVLQGGEVKEFLNRIYLHDRDGKTLDSASSGVEVTSKSIQKSSVVKGNRIEYRIDLNPLGEDLVAGSDQITLIDEMSDTLMLDITTLRVVNTRDNTPVEVTASTEGQILRVILPDATPLTITYTANVNAVPDSFVNLSNVAYWSGYAASSGSGDRYDNFHYTIGGTAGGGKYPHVKLMKYDKDNITSLLSGATFRMEEGKMTDKGFVPSEGRVWTGTTGDDGTLTFGSGGASDPHMAFNMVYRVTETAAPEGYLLDQTPYYFIVAKKVGDTYPKYPDGVYVHYEPTVYQLAIANRSSEIVVQKVFQSADGSAIPALPGTYRFGLYEDAQASGAALQTVELVIGSPTENNTVRFQKLDPTKTYYVFELDDAGKPILPGQFGYVGKIPYQVIYASDPQAGDHAVTHGQTVTVTNRMGVEGLPETGGTGTAVYRLAGLILSGTAILGFGLVMLQSRKEKHRNGR